MNESILSLPDNIIKKITLNLVELKDLIAFGDSHEKIKDIIYKNPECWTSEMLFPANNKEITDLFIQKFVPKITRHYGILNLKMIELYSLSWYGYLLIFDQFAHSVKRIEIKSSSHILNKLVHHLSIFAGNLILLQQHNNIPITFRQYAFDDEKEYERTLVQSNYLGYGSLPNLFHSFSIIQLDDPPFERLDQFKVSLTDNHEPLIIQQLNILSSFLSGRPTPKKRSREMLDSNHNKFIRKNESELQFNHLNHHYKKNKVLPY